MCSELSLRLVVSLGHTPMFSLLEVLKSEALEVTASPVASGTLLPTHQDEVPGA